MIFLVGILMCGVVYVAPCLINILAVASAHETYRVPTEQLGRAGRDNPTRTWAEVDS